MMKKKVKNKVFQIIIMNKKMKILMIMMMKKIRNFKQSGKYYEYKALKLLEKNGYKVARIPTSASGNQPLPDIIATKDYTIYAIEVKSTSKDYIRVDKDQIEKLFRFCDMFNFCNCQPTVMVFYKKFKTVKLYLLNYNDRGRNFKKQFTR